MANLPNLITIGRVILALFTISLLFAPSEQTLMASFVLTALVIWGDGIDGFIARKFNLTSKLGAILDIAGDRVVEMAYWIVFAVLNWIPAWVPLIFLVRGTFVDAIRAQASEQGLTAFGEKTMMSSGIGKFLVASNFSRFTYAVVKALAFCFMILAHTKRFETTLLPAIAMYLTYASVIFCLLRGLPVIVEGQKLFALRND